MPLGFIAPDPLDIGLLDLVPVLIGIGLALVFVAGWTIYGPIFQVLKAFKIPSYIPFIGGSQPFGFLSDLLNGVLQKLWQTTLSDLRPFGHLLWSLGMTIWQSLYTTVETLTGLAAQMVGISQSSQDGLAQLRAKEQNDINTIDDVVAADVTALQNEINARFEQVAQGVDADVASLQNEMDARFSQVAQGVDGDVNSLQAEMDARFSQVAQGVDADVASLQNEMDARFSEVAQGVDNDINTLEQKITNGVTTAENFATGLVSGLGVGSIAQTLTSLQSQVSKIATDTEECLDPLCDTVTPNASQLGKLGQLLKDLEGLFEAGALMGLLVAAVEDPKGTARVVQDVAGWVAPLSLDLVDVVGEAAGVHL